MRLLFMNIFYERERDTQGERIQHERHKKIMRIKILILCVENAFKKKTVNAAQCYNEHFVSHTHTRIHTFTHSQIFSVKIIYETYTTKVLFLEGGEFYYMRFLHDKCRNIIYKKYGYYIYTMENCPNIII